MYLKFLLFILICSTSYFEMFSQFIIKENYLDIEIQNFLLEKKKGTALDKSKNLLIVCTDLQQLSSCIPTKINNLLKTSKELINNSETMLIIESDVKNDAFAVKDFYSVDYFIEDTTSKIINLDIFFPDIFIITPDNIIYAFEYDEITDKLSEIGKLINAEQINPKEQLKIDETFFFAEAEKSTIHENNLMFYAKKRNELLSYNLKNKSLESKFKVRPELFYKFENLNKSLLDTLFKNSITMDYLFQIYSFDLSNSGEITYFVNMLNKLSLSTEEQRAVLEIASSNGILKIDKNSTFSFSEFENDFQSYSDFSCLKNESYLLLLEHYLDDDELGDSSPVIIRKSKNQTCDTILIYKQFQEIIDTAALNTYEPIFDKILLSEDEIIYLLSKNVNQLFLFENSNLSSIKFDGSAKNIIPLKVQDFYLNNSKIYISFLYENKNRIIQEYSLDGEFLKETIFSYKNDELVSSSFVTNNEKKIIILNKWKYHRWTIEEFL